MAHALTVDDLWPLVVKLPGEERARLVGRLLSFDDDWMSEELFDLRDWSRLADPADAELLDPAGGIPPGETVR